MRELNNYWVDKNNNRWSCNIYTKKKAIELSKTLINCRDCRDCRDCSYCRDNPQRYITPRIGRDKRQTTFYWWKDNEEIKTWVVCGCYKNTIENFEAKVKEVHGNNEHGKAYIKEIKKVKYLMK